MTTAGLKVAAVAVKFLADDLVPMERARPLSRGAAEDLKIAMQAGKTDAIVDISGAIHTLVDDGARVWLVAANEKGLARVAAARREGDSALRALPDATIDELRQIAVELSPENLGMDGDLDEEALRSRVARLHGRIQEIQRQYGVAFDLDSAFLFNSDAARTTPEGGFDDLGFENGRARRRARPF